MLLQNAFRRPKCNFIYSFRMKPKWKGDLPLGKLALMTHPKGSMNIESFKLWMEHFAKYILGGKCVLISGGALLKL